MTFNSFTATVDEAFFLPLKGLAQASPHHQTCPEFSDEDMLRLGIVRVLESSASGRAFLQEHGDRNEAEDQRRTKRAAEACAKAGSPLGSLLQAARKAIQCSVKFVRWLRQSIRDPLAENHRHTSSQGSLCLSIATPCRTLFIVIETGFQP